jgi:hypothetical protein
VFFAKSSISWGKQVITSLPETLFLRSKKYLQNDSNYNGSNLPYNHLRIARSLQVRLSFIEQSSGKGRLRDLKIINSIVLKSQSGRMLELRKMKAPIL